LRRRRWRRIGFGGERHGETRNGPFHIDLPNGSSWMPENALLTGRAIGRPRPLDISHGSVNLS
jgi:hypothetical protein